MRGGPSAVSPSGMSTCQIVVVIAPIAEEQSIEGLGQLTDFDPHDANDRPTCPGVYVFYDISNRPIYVGKAKNISTRVRGHADKFWFKYPIVSHAAYVEIRDETLRNRVLTDPHSPARFRVNGVVRNVDAWYEAFGVKPGEALYLPPEQRVRIW